MKNREFVQPGHVHRDVGNAKGESSNKVIEQPKTVKVVPLARGDYNPDTIAQKKGAVQGSYHNVNTPPPVDQRKIKGYKNTIYRSDTTLIREGGRVVARDGAQGKVEVKTNHPNTDINKTYG